MLTIPDIAREGADFVNRLKSDNVWVVLVEKTRAGLGDQVRAPAGATLFFLFFRGGARPRLGTRGGLNQRPRGRGGGSAQGWRSCLLPGAQGATHAAPLPPPKTPPTRQVMEAVERVVLLSTTNDITRAAVHTGHVSAGRGFRPLVAPRLSAA